MEKHRLLIFHGWLYWVFLGVILSLLNCVNNYDSDEGVILDGAWSLINGKKLYGDIFEYIPPASFYFISMVWEVTEPSYQSAIVVSAMALFLGAIVLFKTAEIINGKYAKANYLPPMLFCLSSAFWPTINHNSYNVVLLIMAIFFCVRSIDRQSLMDLFVAGFLSGLAFDFLQHKSLAFSLAVISFLLIASKPGPRGRYFRYILIYAIGLILPMLLLLYWPVSTLVEHLIEFPIFHYMEVNQGLSPLPLLLVFLWIILLYSILRPERCSPINLLFIVQSALLITTLQRTDWSHVVVVIFPALLLASSFLASYQLLNESHSTVFADRLQYFGSLFSIFWFALIFFGFAGRVASNIRFASDGREAIVKTVSFIKDNCSSIYAGPFIPGLYFETRMPNLTPYGFLLTNFNTMEQFMAAHKALEKSPPECAVTAYGMVDKFNYDKNNVIDDFIVENYTLISDAPFFSIYKLKGSSLERRK
jgi:hypothetical protein